MLRLWAADKSRHQIAAIVGIGQSTVNDYLVRARRAGIDVASEVDDVALGGEKGDPFSIFYYEIGTLATIADWRTLPDGLLGIVADGGDRFTIQTTQVQSNQLLTAGVALIPGDPVVALPSQYAKPSHLPSETIEEAGPLHASITAAF